jgi:hypothetical protein
MQCPEDPEKVKLRLKATKGEVLRQAISWILRHDRYVRLRKDDQMRLLWIRGGAGKGKTMVSIGLIDELLNSPSTPMCERTTVIYFFCQNADQQLNTAESVVKGLIRRLFEEHSEGRSALSVLWDDDKRCPYERALPLSELWGILNNMVRKCKCDQLYIVVDALDECQVSGLQELLELLARDGLSWSKVKWLLTSRPKHEVEHIVFPGDRGREQLNLDLESDNLTQAVTAFITNRVEALARRRRYDAVLKHALCEQLVRKAEATFLWASLVCKQLENASREDSLTTIDNLPLGLHDLYDKSFRELGRGEPRLVRLRMRLLKAMLLTFRPLQIDELHGILNEDNTEVTERNIDLCAYFIRRRKDESGSTEAIEFQHQSARDFLAGIRIGDEAAVNTFVRYGHAEIAVSMLSFLNQHLKVNILGLARPMSAEENENALAEARSSSSLSHFRYAAVFWAQHLCNACSPDKLHALPQGSTVIIEFLMNKVMEWFECLGWLGELAEATAALRLIESRIKNIQVRLAELAERYEADKGNIV